MGGTALKNVPGIDYQRRFYLFKKTFLLLTKFFKEAYYGRKTTTEVRTIA
ncbi:hypothetical protein LREP572_00431 [Limosilactobacillus reuteri]|uniref:Uncharacterized protein n=1 Tax=Limosilactobacillus reuteri subsp. rodentium (strain DSM 17509 / CIP 109821 / 100-23) TaxID=349123 RepID=B3XNF6_LIMR1|nr:hypothetical protein Lreu23DRAFT_4950 [Limosilactobacillus reuteri subsp. rodentium]VTZ88764.1 hypothetical protein LREP572_00431 [Limosilactobacillus reuteri]